VSEELFTTGPDHTAEGKAPSFGQRAAALAGIVVSAGALTIGLSSQFGDTVDIAHTTCCPPHQSSVE
jgi:hypothetical protein